MMRAYRPSPRARARSANSLGRAGRAPSGCRGRLCGREHRQANFCRRRSKQRHTAGCPAIEVRIVYPFHPRSGAIVAAIGAKRHAGAEHFIIRQPDRTLALLPAWMTEAGRGIPALVATPRLPIEHLAELCTLLDALMASCSGDPSHCKGASDGARARSPGGPVQRDAADGGAAARVALQDSAAAADAADRGGRRTTATDRIGSSRRRGGW